jgi:hypothetical protein
VTAGYQHQLGGHASVSADYVHAWSREMLMMKGRPISISGTTWC